MGKVVNYKINACIEKSFPALHYPIMGAGEEMPPPSLGRRKESYRERRG
jgi:hypothetical protein